MWRLRTSKTPDGSLPFILERTYENVSEQVGNMISTIRSCIGNCIKMRVHESQCPFGWWVGRAVWLLTTRQRHRNGATPHQRLVVECSAQLCCDLEKDATTTYPSESTEKFLKGCWEASGRGALPSILAGLERTPGLVHGRRVAQPSTKLAEEAVCWKMGFSRTSEGQFEASRCTLQSVS